MRRKIRSFLARQRAKIKEADSRAFVWSVLGRVRKTVVMFRKTRP